MEPTVKKVVGLGRGLAWSPLELLALAETAPLVFQDAAIGSGQTAAALQRRIHSRFAARAPPAAGTKPESGGDLDPRRWGGRTARACKVRWDAIKASCILYKQAVDFVDGANMTGNDGHGEGQVLPGLLQCARRWVRDGRKVETSHYNCSRRFLPDRSVV